MTDSLETSEREAEEPRMVRLPVREASKEPAPPPVAAGYEAHPVGTGERIKRLERDAARYRWLRDKANEGKNWEPMAFSCSPSAPLNWADSLHGADLDAAVDAALTLATKETTK